MVKEHNTGYHADDVYLNTLREVLSRGTSKSDRTGTGTISLFSPQMRFDLTKGFPLLTTKRTSLRIIAEELIWFISGDTNLKGLLDKDVNIWNQDAYRFYKERYPNSPHNYKEFLVDAKDHGYDLGPIYGSQWRSFKGENNEVDQIEEVINSIKTDPYSRRHIVTAWDPTVLDRVALPSCHTMFQFYVDNGRLSCHLYQRQ